MNTQSMMRMLILILTLIFWISNPKSILRQIWVKKVKILMFRILCEFVILYKKVKVVRFAWRLGVFLEDYDSYSNIRFLDFQSWVSFSGNLVWKSQRYLFSLKIDTHTHTHTQRESNSRMLILTLELVFWNSKPISTFFGKFESKKLNSQLCLEAGTQSILRMWL